MDCHDPHIVFLSSTAQTVVTMKGSTWDDMNMELAVSGNANWKNPIQQQQKLVCCYIKSCFLMLVQALSKHSSSSPISLKDFCFKHEHAFEV